MQEECNVPIKRLTKLFCVPFTKNTGSPHKILLIINILLRSSGYLSIDKI